MIVLLSPAKSLDISPHEPENYSLPQFQTEANKLIRELKKYKRTDLQDLMNISESLADENFKRYRKFKQRYPLTNSKRAVNTFSGEVYRGLEASEFNTSDDDFAQKHLRILSGLYGLLKPLDMIQPYRLEMGSRLSTSQGKNLYEFWGDKLTKSLNKTLKAEEFNLVVNLASEEYFKAVRKKKLKAKVLSISFKEYHDGTLKFISFSAKKARGLMARYIIKNRIIDASLIKGFDLENYSYSEEGSTDGNWLFIR